jgi:hypothetical protein
MGRDCASGRRSNRAGRGRPENLQAKASAELDVATITVERSPPKRRNREISRAVPVQAAAQASHPSLSGAKFDRPLLHQEVRANRRDFLRLRIARHFRSLPRL